jgi:hypothetical protein
MRVPAFQAGRTNNKAELGIILCRSPRADIDGQLESFVISHGVND